MLSNYRLPDQEEGEDIIMVVRMDFFILLRKILFFVLLCAIPFGFYGLIGMANPQILAHPIFAPLALLTVSAYCLFAVLFFFFSFIDYYLDIWFITTERIIDVQQNGLFSRTISEQKLFRIQDVTSEVNGIIPTIFDFGDLHVQDAGAKERFFFDNVPNPDKIRDTIIKLVQLNQTKHREEMIAETVPPSAVK